MTVPRMLEDIRGQADSISGVADYQFGAGRRAVIDAATALNAASRIVISGMGASYFAAIPLWYMLAAEGRAPILIETSELLHYGKHACRNAAVILVSRSGESVEIVKLIPSLREFGATIIGVTNERDGALARDADRLLLVNSGRDEMVAVQTYTGTVMALLLLGAAVADAFDDSLRRACNAAASATAATVEYFLSASAGWRDFLDGARFVYLMSRGPSLASAHEGALLFNETAKIPSAAISAGAFRHGPVEVVDENFRAVVFATQTATRRLDLNLAADLGRVGGNVQTIASDGSWPIASTTELLAPVVEIVPIQIAAMRAAEWRGIRPGEFRYVSQVTTRETGFKSCR